MVGDGRIALAAVDQLLAIGQVSAPLLDAVVAYMADGNEWAARAAGARARLGDRPGAARPADAEGVRRVSSAASTRTSSGS